MAAEEYLPPVVTKLKADLSDFMAGIAQARAAMKEFAQGTKADMEQASKAAGAQAGMVMVREIKTVIHKETDDVGEGIGDLLNPGGGKPAEQAGKKMAGSFLDGVKSMMMPGLIGIVILALPFLSTAVAGAIQLGLGLGFIGLGAFMLRQEPALIAAANRFKERVASVFRTASAPMLGPFIIALDKIGLAFERIAPMISRGFAALAPAIVPLAEGIGLMLENMAPGFTEMIVKAGPIIMAFAATLPGIGTGLGEFFMMIADHAPEIAMFIEDMGRIVPAVLRGISGVMGFFIMLYGWISKLATIMRDAGWETPLHGLVTSGKALWEWISSVGPKVGKFFVDLGTDIGNFFSGLGTTIATWAGNVVDNVGDFLTGVGDGLAKVPGIVGGAIAAVPGILKTAAITAFEAFFFWTAFGVTKVVVFLNGLPERIRGIMARSVIILNELAEKIGGLFAKAWLWVTQTTRAGVDSVVTTAEELPHKVGAFFGRLYADAVTWIGNMRVQVVTITGGLIKDVTGFFSQLPGKVGDWLVHTKNRAVEIFKDASKWLYEAGKDLLKGLINGINDMVGWAVGKVMGVGDKIKEGIKKALGIKSPSTVFAEIGRMTMLGFAQGVTGEQSGIRAILGALAPPSLAMAGSVGLARSAASGGFGGGGTEDNRPWLIQLLAPNGEVLLEQLIPAAQRRKTRSGQTGLS